MQLPADAGIIGAQFLGGSGSYLGVGVAEVTPERAKALKLKEERGAEITSVEADSPAAKAGLKAHDVVLEYNGQRVEGTEQFTRMVRETPAERQVRLTINRDGATQTLTATIGQRKGFGPFRRAQCGSTNVSSAIWNAAQRQLQDFQVRMPDIPRPNMSWQSGMLGVEAESLADQLAEFFGVKEGVLVRSVVKDSAAAKGRAEGRRRDYEGGRYQGRLATRDHQRHSIPAFEEDLPGDRDSKPQGDDSLGDFGGKPAGDGLPVRDEAAKATAAARAV